MARDSIFDNQAEHYEAWFAEHSFAYVSELRAVRALLPDSGNGVEIGVGTGRFGAPLGIRTGIEPSRAMAEIAKKKGLEVVPGVAENLPFPDAAFDFALMVTTVCFLDDIDLAFREAFRVIKQGGSFLIGFVDRKSPIGRSYEQRKNESVFYRNARFYSVEDLLPHLTAAGFTTFSFCQTLFTPLEDMREPAPVRTGHGEGSFVVIKAHK